MSFWPNQLNDILPPHGQRWKRLLHNVGQVHLSMLRVKLFVISLPLSLRKTTESLASGEVSRPA